MQAVHAVYSHTHTHTHTHTQRERERVVLRYRRLESKRLIKNYHRMIAINTLTLWISHKALETSEMLGDMS